MARTQSPLNVRHREAARRIGYGEDYKEIAESLGVTLDCIYKWLRRDDFAKLVSVECDRYIASLKPKLGRILNEQLQANGWLRADALKLAYQRNDKLEGLTDSRVVISFGDTVAVPGTPDTGDVDDGDTGQTEE